MSPFSLTILSFLLSVENGLSYVPSYLITSNKIQQRCISLNQNQLPFVANNKDRSTFILKSTEEAVEGSTTEDEETTEEESTDEISAEATPTPEAEAEEDNMMKLYVGSLPTNYDRAEIREMLAPYCTDESTIKSISVPTDRMTGLPRGFGFIEMEKESATKAIAGLSGVEIDGLPIKINEQLSKEELLAKRAADAARREEEMGTKIYCGNISFDTTKEVLEEEFSKYGTVNDVYLPIDTRSGFKRGFAFIRMKDEDEAQAAIEGLNGINLEGRTIEVNASLPRGQAPPKRNRRFEPRTKIYIGNLPFDATPDSLSTIFYNYGTVLDCYLPTDINTGNSRGFGFITMPPEDAQKAIEELDGIEFDGRELRINEAQPKPRRPRDDYDGY